MEARAADGYTVATDLGRRDDRRRRDRARSARGGRRTRAAGRTAGPRARRRRHRTRIGVGDAPLDGAASIRGQADQRLAASRHGRRSRSRATQQEIDAIAKGSGMTSVHVVGATGYAAAELDSPARRASRRARSRRSRAAARAGARMCDLFPSLPAIELVCSPSGSVRERVQPGDVVFLAGNHEVAHEHAPALLAAGARVIDLSDAYRLERPRATAPSTVCPSAIATRSRRARSSRTPAVTSPRRCSR